MKRIAAVVALIGIMLGAAPADAKRRKTVHSFLGTVVAVNVDDDASTPDSLTFDVIRGNNAGSRWAARHDWRVTVDLGATTAYSSDWEELLEDPSDLRLGDGVHVRSVRSGTGLFARSVRMVLQEYYGPLDDFDADMGSLAIAYEETNEVADEWLATQDWPEVADADLAEDAIVTTDEGDDPEAGWTALVLARPTEDGDGLEAVYVEAWQTEDASLLSVGV